MYSSPLAEALAPEVLERFVRYARVDTQADRTTKKTPSTPGQLDLIRMLESELRELGLDDVTVSDKGAVYATLRGTGPAIALLAHVDVSPDAPGAGVEPIVHRGYDGGVIELPRNGTRLDPATTDALPNKTGHDLVTSSGDTLLGADDKAGVAEIMAAVAHLATHSDLPRTTLRVCFTVDEEIGEGADSVDLELLGAEAGYTLDGSEAGELQNETFTAAEATLTIKGVDIHPGFATGKLVNAAKLAGRVLAALPADLSPEGTSGRDGFIHPFTVEATAPEATVVLIVRDFDDAKLEQHVATLRRICTEQLGDAASWDLSIRPQYPNMRTYLDARPEVVEHALEAIRQEGLDARTTVIRGGTDGSVLSARGLPTPNIFTGGHEFHSVREWASVNDMASAAAVVVRLAGVWAK